MFDRIKRFYNNIHVGQKGIFAVLMILMIVAVVVTLTSKTKKPENTAPTEPVYVAQMNGIDTIVYANGTKAFKYSFDADKNIIDTYTGEVAVKAADVDRAVIIEVEVTPEPTPEVKDPNQKTFPFNGRISADGVRLRGAPTTEGKILLEFTKNAKVEVVDETGDWCEVTYDGQTGYVMSTYVLVGGN